MLLKGILTFLGTACARQLHIVIENVVHAKLCGLASTHVHID